MKDGSVVKTTALINKDEERILVHTGANSSKVKRIKRDPKVMIEPSTVFGKSFEKNDKMLLRKVLFLYIP